MSAKGFSPAVLDSLILKAPIDQKRQVFEAISKVIAVKTGVPYTHVLNEFLQNEISDPAAMGRGIAVPQITLRKIIRPFSMMLTLEKPIAFDTPDRQSIDIIYALVSPAQSKPLHLQRLASISRFLKDQELCDYIRQSTSTDKLNAVLLEDKKISSLAA